MPDELPPEPKYKTPDPRIRGRAKVYADLSKTAEGDDFYIVDLGRWTCECSNGSPYYWFEDKQKWLIRRACNHKIRALADLVQAHEAPEDLFKIYLKFLSQRYNAFEVVSAFHKELRRGDFEKAYFWGMVLTAHRGLRGVMRYMLGIIYEETRDHGLADWLLEQTLHEPTYKSAARGIAWFCLAPKKWYLPHRVNIFFDEMWGYNELCDRFSNDVARGGDIIPYMEYRDELIPAMREGAGPRFQFGVKGLQKCEGVDIQELRWWMAQELTNVGVTGGHVNGIEARMGYIVKKRSITQHIGYHDINMLADLVGHREPLEAGLTSQADVRRVLRRPKIPSFPFGKAPRIPLYAQDNHTWAGKAKIKKYPTQILPEAEQTDLDLRWCGAYYGVAYRTVSVIQHGTVAEWHRVVWPTWLHEVVSRLWY